MPTMNNTLGGNAGYGENAYSTSSHSGDLIDGSVSVDVTSVFGSDGINFLGTNYTEIHISTNGAITFGAPSTSYNMAGAADFNVPALMPFYSDMNLNGGGEIYWDIDPANGKITITWDGVAPYDGQGSNSFQVVLSDQGNGDMGIEYIYEDIQWSGAYGVPAISGVTDGNGNTHLLDSGSSPLGDPGYDDHDFGTGDPVGTVSFSTSGGQLDVLPTAGTGPVSNVTNSGLGDLILGSGGDDLLAGGLNNDTIDGGAGNDSLSGGSEVTWTDVGNGANVHGTGEQDFWRFSADTNSFAIIRLNDSYSTAAAEDAQTDYILIDSTNDNVTVTIGDFDMSRDKIVLLEEPANTAWSHISGSGAIDLTITYANGNQQSFTIYSNSSVFDPDALTTTMPTFTASGDDSLTGGLGDDLIQGGDGNDTLLGGEGSDTLENISGATSMDGGAGADAFVVHDGEDGDFGDVTVTGGESGSDIDTLDLGQMTGDITVTYSGSETGTVTDGTDTLNFSEIEQIVLSDGATNLDATADTYGMNVTGGAGSDTIATGTGNDVVNMGDGDNSVSTGAGNDTVDDAAGNPGFTGQNTIDVGLGDDMVFSGYGNDLIFGGAGNDTLNSQWGEDTVDGGTGDDSIINEWGDSSLIGGEGADTIVGQFGSETIAGGVGDDSLLGGDNADTFLLEDGFGADTIIGGEGGLDADVLDLAALTGPVTVHFTGSEAGTITDGTDTLNFAEIEQVLLSGGGDLVTTAGYALNIDAGAGDDTVLGSGDNGIGDTIDGGSGDDSLRGWAGNDSLIGGDGNDTLLGDDGNDTLSGGAGDDLLTNWAGAAQMDGGDGSDNFRLFNGTNGSSAGFHGVHVIGGETADDLDVLDLSYFESAVTVTFTDVDSGTITDGADTMSFTQIEQIILSDNADSVDFNGLDVDVDIVLGNGDDHVLGGFGNDTLLGGAGGDTIIGGAGDDLIDGGDGDDLLRTGDGQDTLLGGDGNDTLLNSTGDDSLVGGAGDDSIIATAGDDTLEGGDGNDTLEGGADNDSLIGGTGDDLLTGDATSPPVILLNFGDASGAGTATDDSGFGNHGIYHGDATSGGTGWTGDAGDTALVLDGNGDYVEIPHDPAFAMAEGTVSIRFNADTIDNNDALFSRDSSNFDGGGHIRAILQADGRVQVRIQSDSQSYLVTTDPGVVSTGTWHHVAVTFGPNGVEIYVDGVLQASDPYTGGIGGNSEPWTLGADQRISGDGVADNLTGYFDGQIDEFALIGDQMDAGDIAYMSTTGVSPGTPGDDTLIGGIGSDTLVGMEGADSMTGGDDDDTFIMHDAFGNDTIVGGEGGQDDDVVDFSALTGPVTVIFTGEEAGTITDGTYTLNFSEIERLILTDQADTVDATATTTGVNITAGAGDDTIMGGSGGDTITGGEGSDYIDGGDGDDFLRTGTGNDTLIGGRGNDTLMNSEGDDSLDGGEGDDSIIATGGNDTLRGGTGDDTMDGGDDADTFIIEDNFGNDTITGGEGGDDYDTIDLSMMTGPVTVTYTGDEAGTITDGNGNTITFSEIERIVLTDDSDSVDGSADSAGMEIVARGGDDTVTGGSGNDSLNGGAGNDSLSGGDGNDFIQTGSGADTVDGGAGNDTIWGADDASTVHGGDGNDEISMRGGDESINGGAGSDTIYLYDNFGNDTIIGGEDADGSDVDVIDLSGMTGPVTVTYTGDEAGTITDENGNTIIFSEIERIILTDHGDSVDGSADNAGLDIDAGGGNDSITAGGGDDHIRGGQGHDTIHGGDGNDSLTGGDGNDVFVYNPGDGSDTITDFGDGQTGDGDTTNNDFIDLSEYYDSMAELRADYDDDGVLNQSNDGANGVDYSDNKQFQDGDGLTFENSDRNTFTSDNTGVVCFAPGTMILTPSGEVPIERLRPGDLVVTRDNGPQPLVSSAMRRLGPVELMLWRNLRPVLIKPGAFGQERELIVSRQHALLLRDDNDTHLVRAIHLARIEGDDVRVMEECRQITYIHLMFDAHQIIFSNGLPSESFYPGPMALRALDPTKREELRRLFPDLLTPDGDAATGVRWDPACAYAKPRILPDHLDGLRQG